MASLRPIGVLGGMGPEATVLLQQKLIRRVPAVDDSDHIPLLIDMNPQVPSRIAHLIEGKGDNPGPVIAAMAQRLEKAGATALAMPCNTAHYYADHIRDAVTTPFLDMIELAADHALERVGAGGSVGILASPAVKLTGLFNTRLEARGLSVVWPENQDRMLTAIRAIKAEGPCQVAREILYDASAELLDAGATLQLVACSEFSIIADSVASQAETVDTIDLLVEAMVIASKG